MSIAILLQFLVVLAAIYMGARYSGVGLGVWGGVGLFILMMVFGVAPTAPPVDVLLIILAVITAASVMDAAGGIDFLVRVAEKIIRANPKRVTIVAPLTTWTFTFLAGTGHIVYPLLPVIYEVAHSAGIRPERPMAVATIASQQSITASPVSAATAALIGMFTAAGLTDWGLAQMMMVCVPSTLVGVIVAGFISMFLGKDLADDPEYQARVKAGLVPATKAAEERGALPKGATLSAYIFLAGVAVAVAAGFIPELRTLPGAAKPLGMATTLEVLMLVIAAVILAATKVNVDAVVKTPTMRAGVVALVGIFGLAWLGDSFISANKEVIITAVGDIAKANPWTFAPVLFFVSVLLYSQAATTRAVMPLGLALGIAPQYMIAMFPSVNGYFFIPTYGSLVAAISFDASGTTKIGKYVLNHSFMIPGLVATIVAVATGLGLASVMF